MRVDLTGWLYALRSSFWLIPSLMGLTAIIAAFAGIAGSEGRPPDHNFHMQNQQTSSKIHVANTHPNKEAIVS